MINHIDNFLFYLKSGKNLSKNSIDAYKNDLTQFHNYLTDFFKSSEYNISDVDLKILRGHIRVLFMNKIKKTSISRKTAAIRSFFKFLANSNCIEINPALSLVIPKAEKRLPEFADEESMTNVMQLPDTSNILGLRDLAILELFYSTGIRESELMGLKSSDLYLSSKLVKVFGKGSKERMIPIGQKAIEALNNYIGRRAELFTDKTTIEDKKYIFLTTGGKKCYRTAIYNIVRFYLTKAYGGKKCSPHILRHTFATHLLDRGADIESVKQMLGHSNLSTTQIYTHVSIDHLKKVYSKAHPKADTKFNVEPKSE